MTTSDRSNLVERLLAERVLIIDGAMGTDAGPDGEDAGGPAREQAVGEAAGRAARVEATASFDPYAEVIERVLELGPASRDIGAFGSNRKIGSGVDLGSGLVDP